MKRDREKRKEEKGKRTGRRGKREEDREKRKEGKGKRKEEEEGRGKVPRGRESNRVVKGFQMLILDTGKFISCSLLRTYTYTHTRIHTRTCILPLSLSVLFPRLLSTNFSDLLFFPFSFVLLSFPPPYILIFSPSSSINLS